MRKRGYWRNQELGLSSTLEALQPKQPQQVILGVLWIGLASLGFHLLQSAAPRPACSLTCASNQAFASSSSCHLSASALSCATCSHPQRMLQMCTSEVSSGIPFGLLLHAHPINNDSADKEI